MELKLIKTVPIDKIKSDADQPRKTFDKESLELLSKSIGNGFQINPIILDENYHIIVGERRWRALKILGIKELKEGEHFRIVKNLDEKEIRRMQSDEDIQHKPIDLGERDNFWHKIYKKFNFKSQQELANFLNVSEKSIYDAFDRLEMGGGRLGPNKVSSSVVTETQGLPKKERIQLIKTAERKDIGSRKIREYVDVVKRAPETIKKEVLSGELEPEDVKNIMEIKDEDILEKAVEQIKAIKKTDEIQNKMKRIGESREKIKNRPMINILNELRGDEWLKFTRSWFEFDALDSDLEEERALALSPEDHPATFSPTMVADFVRFFTKKNAVVLDPFVGIGSTLVACMRAGRKGIGIDINKKYTDMAKKRVKDDPRQTVIQEDAWNIKKLKKLPKIDYSITSPPYFEMLKKIDVTQKRRIAKGLPTDYENKSILAKDVDSYVKKLVDLYSQIHSIMKPNGYATVILQNFRDKKRMLPLAWKFAIAMQDSGKWDFKGEKIWCQSHKKLHPFGFPRDWVSNVHHHYCLIFKRVS